MTDIPWYSFYVGDYSRKTAHLSLLEHGAYRLLLDHYYATQTPLPNDATKLSRICRARSPSERKAVLSVVAEFFIENGSLLHHERCDSEINKLLKYSDRQSAAAKRRHSQKPAVAKPRARVPHSHSQDLEAKASSSPPAPLPEWLPIDLWDAYLAMRKKKRATPTEQAVALLLAKLDKWRAKGHDPTQILSKSITSNWTDIFEPKEEYHANAGRNNHVGNAPGATHQPGRTDIGQSKWTTAAEQIIAEDRATGRWADRK